MCFQEEAKDWYWVSSSITLYLIFFKQDLSLNLELIHLTRLSRQLDLRIYLSPFLPHSPMFSDVLPCTWLLHGCWVSEFWSTCLCGRHFTDWLSFQPIDPLFKYLFCVLYIYMYRQDRFFYFLWRLRTFDKLRHYHWSSWETRWLCSVACALGLARAGPRVGVLGWALVPWAVGV